MQEPELRSIAGHEGRYSVTADGRVWSHPKRFGRGGLRPGRWLKPGFNSRGYLCVRLCRNGIGQSHCVHALVASAFVDRPVGRGAKLEVNHINGTKPDNRAENLEWVTRSENVAHAHRIGLHPPGQPKLRLLTVEQARQVRTLHRNGVKQTLIAEQFGVSKAVIGGIVHNRYYKGETCAIPA